jgi:hypothetical protein
VRSITRRLAAGCAWRLPRPEEAIETETCYVGISFYRSLDQTKYRTSLAQVFNERGIGMVVRGGEVETSQEDQQPHLDKTAAAELLAKALKTYKIDHYHQPPRVVLYKTTRFNEDEIAGFASVIESEDIGFADFLSVSRSLIRLYRDGYFSPLRGTCLEIDDTRFLIYTKGTVPFYEMYPGPYIPRTLLITKAYGDGSISGLSQEILALTKMNWNNTQLDGFEPLPVRGREGGRRNFEILRREGYDCQLLSRLHVTPEKEAGRFAKRNDDRNRILAPGAAFELLR